MPIAVGDATLISYIAARFLFMLSPMSSLFLAPIFMAQGIYTKLITPKLPEASGERYGVMGTGEPFKLLIIGDSSAAGVGARDQEKALSGQLVAQLSSRFAVTWKLIARTGLTAQTLISKINQFPAEQFDAIVIAIGVNDVTAGTTLTKWSDSLQQLTNILLEKFSTPKLFLSNIPPMHLFSALPQPLRRYMGEKAQSLNLVSEQFCKENKIITLISFKVDFTPEHLATDGFHPSEISYAKWAAMLSETILYAFNNTKLYREK